MSGVQVNVNIAKQTLEVRDGESVLFEALVSTALKGAGEKNGSECTPRGLHIIRAKIGIGCELNTVFVARRPSKEIFTKQLQKQYPKRDWILTRILWLSGCEAGINRLGGVDTMRRYIYIHGCPDDMLMGVPASHGCIRMTNKDVVSLFDMVSIGTKVCISD